MRPGPRRRLEGRRLDVGDRAIGDRPWRTWPPLIEEPGEALGEEPLPPLGDGLLVQPQLASDDTVRPPCRARQHDARPLRERVRSGPPPRQLPASRIRWR